MEKLVKDNGCLNVEDLIMNSESFKKMMDDAVITEEEVQKQNERVIALLKELEAICTPEQIEVIRRLMAEVCVLVSVNSVVLQ